MTIAWLTAVLELPAATHDAATAFWLAVTRSALSPRQGRDGAVATLVPPDGDAYVRVQRVAGPARVHLDLHVPDVAALSSRAVALGAELVATPGIHVLRSPAGLTFCIGRDGGEALRPAPVVRADGGRERLDQLAIDVPAPCYEAECAFWSALTGWEHRAGLLPELSYLVRPPALPLRLILQRLGDDDPDERARAHLDLACGDEVAAAETAHERLGATLVQRFEHWTTLRDPAGLPYCLTARDPVSGTRRAT